MVFSSRLNLVSLQQWLNDNPDPSEDLRVQQLERLIPTIDKGIESTNWYIRYVLTAALVRLGGKLICSIVGEIGLQTLLQSWVFEQILLWDSVGHQ